VTHDPQEALALADRLLTLENGLVASLGPTEDALAWERPSLHGDRFSRR
jgi:ABC-type sulfate/molybdate transport systems ATPase subunit